MNRAGFLKSLALGGAGLIVGGELIEEMARRLHVRKSFPSAGIPEISGRARLIEMEQGLRLHGLHGSTYPHWQVGDHVAIIPSSGAQQYGAIVTSTNPFTLTPSLQSLVIL